jgi:hypothetical protein
VVFDTDPDSRVRTKITDLDADPALFLMAIVYCMVNNNNYLRLFQTLDTVDAAKAFIEDNKIAVIGFFKVPYLF